MGQPARMVALSLYRQLPRLPSPANCLTQQDHLTCTAKPRESDGQTQDADLHEESNNSTIKVVRNHHLLYKWGN